MTATDRDSEDNGRLRYELRSVMEGDYFPSISSPMYSSSSNLFTYHSKTAARNASIEKVTQKQPTHYNKPPLSLSPTSWKTSSSYSDFFHIDQQGIITAHVVIDRELFQYFRFKLTAFDHGSPPLSATTFIHISVMDQNDERPYFNQPSYTFNLREDKKPGEHIGRVTATDKDTSPYNNILYSFELGYVSLNEAEPRNISSDKHFSINPDTGDLHLLKTLDRENVQHHRFNVIAFDPSNTSMSTDTSVVVNVLDVNDNPPNFIFPTPFNFTTTHHLTKPPSTPHFITRVLAGDADEGDNAVILYDLICVRKVLEKSPEDMWVLDKTPPIPNSTHLSKHLSTADYSQYFHLDHKSGTILMTSQPPHVTNKATNESEERGRSEEAYELTIMIRDSGIPVFSNTSRLLVVLKTHSSNFSSSYSSSSIFNLNRSVHVLIVSFLLLFSAFVLVLLLIFAACVFQKRKKMSSLATIATIGCDGNMFGFDNEKQIEEKISRLVNETKAQSHITPCSYARQMSDASMNALKKPQKHAGYCGISLHPPDVTNLQVRRLCLFFIFTFVLFV